MVSGANTAEAFAPYFREVFQETGSGDFGLLVKDGPLFRVHSTILAASGGFIGKVRQFGKMVSRTMDAEKLVKPADYFKAHGLERLLPDLKSIQFSQPVDQSSMSSGRKGQDPLKPGFTTAHFIGGITGAVKRADPFFLAECYEVPCDCERMVELLRFVYCGQMSFFNDHPASDKERRILTDKMLHICFDAEMYSVDILYQQLLEWFGSKAHRLIGQTNFADAFYHLQHFERRATEENARQALLKTVTGPMLAARDQFRAVTRDPRWASLPVEFVQDTLSYDLMPISSETEVLNLIERWNAKADKSKADIVRLLGCFRPDKETMQTLMSWLRSNGWIAADGKVVDAAGLGGLAKVVSGTAGKGNYGKPKPPRKNMGGTALLHGQKELEDGNENPTEEADATFVQYHGNAAVKQGCSFSLGSAQRLLQGDVMRHAGITRLRVGLYSPGRHNWDPQHEVFVGLSYGESKYFGYLCSATAFHGIFSIRALASAAPEPSAPVHITGSGNKVEFDLSLEIQLHRINLVVTCKLGVIFNGTTATEELFQVSYDTLVHGPGLRYQVVATGLEKDEVEVQLAWVGGGGPQEEIEMPTGPIGFEHEN